MDEINPSLNKSVSADARPENPGPTEATLTLTFNPSPVYVNEMATINVSIHEKPTEGEMQILMAVDEMGNHTTAALATDWEAVVKQTVPSTGQISYDFMSTTAGMYGFKAKYVPKGGSGFLAKDVTGDIEVIRNCTGMSLAGSITSVNDLGNNMYQFTVAYTVESCSDVLGAKLQGGLTAGVIFNENTGTSPMASEVKTTGKDDKPNYVINWQLGDISNTFQQTYYITFTKELSGAGEHTITGDWSVKGTDADGNEVVAEFEALNYTLD